MTKWPMEDKITIPWRPAFKITVKIKVKFLNHRQVVLILSLHLCDSEVLCACMHSQHTQDESAVGVLGDLLSDL